MNPLKVLSTSFSSPLFLIGSSMEGTRLGDPPVRFDDHARAVVLLDLVGINRRSCAGEEQVANRRRARALLVLDRNERHVSTLHVPRIRAITSQR